MEYQDLRANAIGSGSFTEVVDTSFLRISKDLKCIVFFQIPFDEIQFDQSDLQVHKECVDNKWIRLEKQRTIG